MKVLMTLMITLITASNPHLKIDFGSETGGQDWRVLSDNVMGGLSNGEIQMNEDMLKFTGDVSLENNGGFNSIRSPWQNFDLSDFQEVKIRFRSEGQSFALTMEKDRRWFLPYFKKEFTSNTGEWQEVTIKLSDFKTYQVGRDTGEKISKDDLSKIIRLGIVTNDKRKSKFELELDYIHFE